MDYFNKYYKNHFFQQEKIVFIKKKNFNKLQNIQTNKLVLNGRMTKGPLPDYLFFRNTEEPQIDKEDYLKYIEYTDNDGRLKEQYRRMDSGSISKDSTSSVTKTRKTKIEFMINKRESKFTNNNSDGKNNEQNAPIFDYLNKKNNERKKKLLYTELMGSKSNTIKDASSSEVDSSDEDNKVNSDSDTNKNLLSDIIKSESNESESESNDEKVDKKDKNKKKKKNKKDKTKSKKKSKSDNKDSKKNIQNGKKVLRSSLKKRNKINNNEKEKEKEKDKEEEEEEIREKKDIIINYFNNKNEDNKEKSKNIDIKKIENKKFENDSNESNESNKNLFGSLSLGNNNEELKYASDTNKNTSTDNRNTTLNKSDILQDNRESGKFGASQNNFKELLKKEIEGQKAILQPNIVRRKARTKNVVEKESSIVKTILISEGKSILEEKDSKNSNSGHFLFTLNGENESEKSEHKNSKNKKQLNEKKKKKKN